MDYALHSSQNYDNRNDKSLENKFTYYSYNTIHTFGFDGVICY